MDTLSSWLQRLREAHRHGTEALNRLKARPEGLSEGDLKRLEGVVRWMRSHADGFHVGISAGVGYQGSVSDLFAKQMPDVGAQWFNVVAEIGRRASPFSLR